MNTSLVYVLSDKNQDMVEKEKKRIQAWPTSIIGVVEYPKSNRFWRSTSKMLMVHTRSSATYHLVLDDCAFLSHQNRPRHEERSTSARQHTCKAMSTRNHHYFRQMVKLCQFTKCTSRPGHKKLLFRWLLQKKIYGWPRHCYAKKSVENLILLCYNIRPS